MTPVPQRPEPDMIRRAAAATLMTLAAAPAGAQTFDVWFAGLKLAEIRLSVTETAQGWRADAALEGRGLADLFVPSSGRAEATGGWDGDEPAPVAFAADGRFGRKPQTVRWRHVPGGAPEIAADPPLRERWYDPAPATLVGALDPVTAAVAALAPRPAAEACGRTIPVFDTRRRFDLKVEPAAAEPDGRLRCEATYVRVSGFKEKHMALPPHPFTTWWRVRDGVASFDRAATLTRWGTATLLRKD
jgi:hypothetical protein